MNKLPKYVADFTEKKVAIIGCGAVGSYLAEILIKMGIILLTLIDFDSFEAENIAKSSCVYRVPEDSGKNKAYVLAKRLNDILGSICVRGISANITSFGPMAFADYEVVILALDNYAAKVFCNQIWMQIPQNRRPLLIFGGTIGESAQSNCLDGLDCCVRCLFDESWLLNPMERTSCTGINYRNSELPSEIVRTTGLASRIAADMMAEQCRAYFIGNRDMINKRIMYSSYPKLGITQSTPIKRRTCPDCKSFYPVENAKILTGMDVLHTTVGELVQRIRRDIGDDKFEIIAPVIEFAKVAYGKVIKDDFCRCCGAELKGIYAHEFRTKYEQLLCDACKNAGKNTSEKFRTEKIGSYIDVFTINNCDEILNSKTLYEVGYSLGTFIEVKQQVGGMDIIDGRITSHIYYCENDQKQMELITELEG